MRATINDIAREVGVSRSLVSFYLVNQGTTRVAETTRGKIDAAIKKLGYRRNEAAAETRTGVCRTVALISDFNHSAASGSAAGEILHGVLATASECGYGVKIYNTALLKQSFDEILRYGIPFVLCFSFFKEHQRTVGAFCREHSLRLCYLQESCVEEFPMVYSDDRTAERELVHYFFRRGHRRFAFLKPEDDVNYSIERRKGWEEGLRECGLEPDPRFISSRHDPNDHYRDLETMLALPKEERPTAFLCTDDNRALRVQFVALRRGIRIPEECEMAGFGDQNASDFYYPVSSTVQPLEQIGAAAFRRVIEERQEGIPSRLLFPVEMIHHVPQQTVM